MSLKKGFLIFCVLLLFTTILCSCGDVIVEPKWIIGVKGADTAVFSSLDYAKLHEVTITVEDEQQDGSVLEETWEGVYLKDVLDYLGITEYSSITLTSSNDSSVEYTVDIINDSLTIMATSVNGKDMKHEDGYIKIIAGNQPENMWIESPAKITVNK
jgi:hypothetical protein